MSPINSQELFLFFLFSGVGQDAANRPQIRWENGFPSGNQGMKIFLSFSGLPLRTRHKNGRARVKRRAFRKKKVGKTYLPSSDRKQKYWVFGRRIEGFSKRSEAKKQEDERDRERFRKRIGESFGPLIVTARILIRVRKAFRGSFLERILRTDLKIFWGFFFVSEAPQNPLLCPLPRVSNFWFVGYFGANSRHFRGVFEPFFMRFLSIFTPFLPLF